MENKEAMKFSLNETYKVKLAFDEPHISDGQFGKSYMYGGWIDNNEVRFFASVSGASSGAFSADNLEGYITPFGQVFVSYPCD